jgi:hypothetical protein
MLAALPAAWIRAPAARPGHRALAGGRLRRRVGVSTEKEPPGPDPAPRLLGQRAAPCRVRK